ncbi:MAG: tRNA (N(6)-L-threonylcarbamoyladenosine(37)-C(2))-methylthiotransferase MtaB [Thermotogae bacterium]|nr:tRNA (N(6)-L-threonylcarbamoyladenosine(37)-C(2))-methylthiotransferase MtaB [Thermotogota bacterium]MCL5032636.1 tRNA (N(6)-L-threonylcarbamoyladenosine(37)-C(2))-methylthiotransferase MtaB [Thermotogota bacterium]
MKYHIYTLGCKFNQYESAKISELLEGIGYERTDFKDADVVVVNSCAVTSEAKRQSLQIARRFKRNSKAKIVLAGCAVHDGEVPDFDLVLGNGEKMRIIEYLDKIGKIESSAYFLNDAMNYSISKNPDRTRGFLSVENGCNWGCAYCAVPHFRGTKIRSKSLGMALDEVRHMVDSGIKEIVVSGINVALYDDNGLKLRDLLDAISKVDGKFRVRLSSIDPLNAMTLENLFENDEKLCHHLHLSVQSGSDAVLRDMGRNYTANHVMKTVQRFRSIDPLFAFSVDIIAGFPTEKNEDFDKTIELLSNIDVMRIHAFPFSPKNGTKASRMENGVGDFTKKIRVKLLKSLSNHLEKKFREKLTGSSQRILVEEIKDGFCEGFNDYYLKYNFRSDAKVGDFVQIDV